MTDLIDNIEGAAVGAPLPGDDVPASKTVKSPDLFARVRNTSATQRRSALMLDIVQRFKLGEMRRYEVEDLLHMSPSGARKYIRELLDFEVIVIDRREEQSILSLGHPVFRLTDCIATVAKFEAMLELPIGPRTPAKRGAAPAGIDKNRHFHLMGDPVPSAVKVHSRPVRPDPLALHPSFFRPPAVDGETLARCTPVIPPRPAAFPVPAVYRLEIGGQP